MYFLPAHPFLLNKNVNLYYVFVVSLYTIIFLSSIYLMWILCIVFFFKFFTTPFLNLVCPFSRLPHLLNKNVNLYYVIAVLFYTVIFFSSHIFYSYIHILYFF